MSPVRKGRDLFGQQDPQQVSAPPGAARPRHRVERERAPRPARCRAVQSQVARAALACPLCVKWCPFIFLERAAARDRARSCLLILHVRLRARCTPPTRGGCVQA